MDKSKKTRIVFVTGGALLLGACAGVGDWLPGRQTATNEQAVVEESGVSLYLQQMHTLATGSPEAQDKLFAAISRRANRSPTTTNRLGLALALATSGHAKSDVARGRSALLQLLSDPGLLLDGERQLSELMLSEIGVRQRVTGDLEAESSASMRQAAAERAQLVNALETARADRARLEKELADAEEKLRAITSIERSIRERSDDDVPQP